MTKRVRIALATGAALAIAVIAALFIGQLIERQATRAFVAEQQEQLAADKAALEAEQPPAFDAKVAFGDCEAQWRASDEARRFWETHTVTARPSIKVSQGLHTVSGTVTGTDGQDDIEANFSCTVLLDDDEWIVDLS